MDLNTYLRKQKKILEEEQFADEQQLRNLYEEYMIKTLLRDGYLLNFNQEDIYEEKNINKKFIGLEFSEDLAMLKDLKKKI